MDGRAGAGGFMTLGQHSQVVIALWMKARLGCPADLLPPFRDTQADPRGRPSFTGPRGQSGQEHRAAPDGLSKAFFFRNERAEGVSFHWSRRCPAPPWLAGGYSAPVPCSPRWLGIVFPARVFDNISLQARLASLFAPRPPPGSLL